MNGSNDLEAQKTEFIYFSNRGSAIFKQALEPLGGRLYREGDRHIDLLYFDQYGGKIPPQQATIGFTLIDRQRTIPLDNKGQMATILSDAGMAYPRVYFDDIDVPDEPGSLWFIKDPMATAGRGIKVVTREQISENFSFGYIIQEAVQDLALMDNRKFTLRAYVLVNKGKLFLFADCICVLHGAVYDRHSQDPLVHFEHSSYMDADGPVQLLCFKKHPDFEQVMRNIGLNIGVVFSAFSNLMKFEKAHTYCLFGVDVLVRTDLSTVVIEINDRPNLVHTKMINQEINVPMVRALCCVLDPVRAAQLTVDAPRFQTIGSL